MHRSGVVKWSNFFLFMELGGGGGGGLKTIFGVVCIYFERWNNLVWWFGVKVDIQKHEYIHA